MTTGMDLKVRRIRRYVTATQLAQAGGWKSHVSISQIEARQYVPPPTLERYENALATFPDVLTSEPIQVMPRELITEPTERLGTREG